MRTELVARRTHPYCLSLLLVPCDLGFLSTLVHEVIQNGMFLLLIGVLKQSDMVELATTIDSASSRSFVSIGHDDISLSTRSM